MAVIDLHCHLDLYDDPKATAAECERRGLYVLSVTTTPSAFEGTCALASPNGRIRTGLGLHPELAAKRAHELALFARLLPDAQYVGEVGLDGSPAHRASFEVQQNVFDQILQLCAGHGGRPLSIHSRGATGKVLDALARVPGAGTPILHWFVGSAPQVRRAADLGAWFSVGPSMLTSERGRNAVGMMPRDRVLTESDGPFGLVDDRPACPWEAWLAVGGLAAIWNETAAVAEARVWSNFRNYVRENPTPRRPSSLKGTAHPAEA